MGSGRSIVHIEIPAKDRNTTAKFYKDLFGWEYEHIGPPMNYTTFQAGNTGGGYPDAGPNSPAGQVVVYMSSEDIDADLKKIEKMGGKTLMPKTEIPGYGWFAMFADPAGNPLALYTGTNPQS